METTEKRSVYSIVTERILASLEQGIVPWKQPWGEATAPQNFITKRPYRGINLLLLGSLPYTHNYFLTFEQAKSIGATIKKGEKAHMVVFWKRTQPKENEETEQGKEQPAPKSILRYYTVFNIDQCMGIPKDDIPEIVPKTEMGIIETCEAVLLGVPNGPAIEHGHKGAYYFYDLDKIILPEKERFVNIESYYDTLFHELVHSTGHPSRLNRSSLLESGSMGIEVYSYEELIAEIGACFLTSHCGINTPLFDNNVAYIAGWAAKLKDHKKWIVSAAAQAQQAVDHLINVPAYGSGESQ